MPIQQSHQPGSVRRAGRASIPPLGDASIIAFGGVCGVGERWSDAAIRELAEEAGVVVAEPELLDLGDGRYESEVVRVVGHLYAVQHTGPFSYSDSEVQQTEWVELAALETWLTTHDVCDDSLELIVPTLSR